MRAWLASHRYALAGALARLARRPTGAMFEASVLGIALALPLAFLLAVENVRALVAHHPAVPEMSVYLALDADSEAVEDVGSRLRAIAGAEAVRFISRADAAARLGRSKALAEVLDALPANPLPDAFTVQLRAADMERLDSLRSEIIEWPQVARVQVDSEWAQKLDALVRSGWLAAVALGLVLALAMVAITFNTVRLQMLQQREEIELSRLIGATEAFVRRPYLYFGALQGLFGAAIGIALVVGMHALAARELARLSAAYGAALELALLPWQAVIPVLATGVGLGGLAAWLCSARAVKGAVVARSRA
jgi:cell division transport system permease protein